MELLEDFGPNLDDVTEAQEEYQKLALKLKADREAKNAAQMAQAAAAGTNVSTTAAAATTDAR